MIQLLVAQAAGTRGFIWPDSRSETTFSPRLQAKIAIANWPNPQPSSMNAKTLSLKIHMQDYRGPRAYEKRCSSVFCRNTVVP
jgi:hypothetical protein